jgi:hypothetical protein
MKFVGKKVVRVEPCIFRKKTSLVLPALNRRNYSTANIGKVLSTGPYEGEYIVYKRNRLRRCELNGEVVFNVPIIDIEAVVEPDKDEEVVFQKDMVDYRHADDKTI